MTLAPTAESGDTFYRLRKEVATNPWLVDPRTVIEAYKSTDQGEDISQEIQRGIDFYRLAGFTPQQIQQRLLIDYYAAAQDAAVRQDPAAAQKIAEKIDYTTQYFADEK